MLKLKSNPKYGRNALDSNAGVNPQTEIDNLYGQLKGLRQLHGVMTSQSRKDFNRIVERLERRGILTLEDAASFRVIDQLKGIEQAEFSGIPERAARLMALLDHRNPKTIKNLGGALLDWAIQDGIRVAIVISDIARSSVLCAQLGDSEWLQVSQAYFERAGNLARDNNGFFLKTVGDGAWTLFRNAASALDFMIELRDHPGPSQIVIHQGAHIGNVILITRDNDISGANANLAARIAENAQAGEIVVADDFWRDIQRIKAPSQSQLRWKKLSNVRLKNFEETFLLWQL